MPEDELLTQDGIRAQREVWQSTASANGNGKDEATVAAEEHNENVHDGRGSFFLFHRARRWNEQEGCWMGWERKRGKLEQFNQALRGNTSAFESIVGPTEQLHGVQYVITLDSDTQLPRDSAAQLIGTVAHPLNRPRYDETQARVIEGHSILQPRVGISMPSAARSLSSSPVSRESIPTRAVPMCTRSLREGSFIGKGIYDVDVPAIARRTFSRNRILSHDLLGAHAISRSATSSSSRIPPTA